MRNDAAKACLASVSCHLKVKKLGLLLNWRVGVLEKKREVVEMVWWSVLEARCVDV